MLWLYRAPLFRLSGHSQSPILNKIISQFKWPQCGRFSGGGPVTLLNFTCNRPASWKLAKLVLQSSAVQLSGTRMLTDEK